MYQEYSMSRRTFSRAVGLLFGVELAGNVIGNGGPVTALLSRNETDAHAEHGHQEGPEDIHPHVEAEAQRLVEEFEKSHPESAQMTERERQLLFVDYAGVALFGHGVKTLIGGRNINMAHYALLGGLTRYKYDLSDKEGRQHLAAEMESSLKALGIIAGTIIGAEGMNADLVAAYEKAKGKSPDAKDRIALMTMLSSCLSSAATTVGSATILKEVSADLCKLEGQFDDDGEQQYDPKMLAVCTSHISNLSGFVLFGDPPFIAMVEKYGFKEAVVWQVKAALPLLAYSMVSATYKLNKAIVEREGLQGNAARTKALKNTKDGLMGNASFLCSFLLTSLRNAASYAGMGSQDTGGIEIWVGEKLMDTLKNISRLPFSDEFDVPDQPRMGMVHGSGVERVLHEQDSLFRLIEEIAFYEGLDGGVRTTTLPDDFVPNHTTLHRLREAIEHRDYAAIGEVCEELHIAAGVSRSIISRLQDVHDNAQLDDSVIEPKKKGWLERADVVHNVFSIDRMKSALGHNLADVVNVFPFQAGCVPFLLTAFNHARQGIEAGVRAAGMDPETGVGQKVMEVSMYLLIEHFSCVADNYVGCKLGLEIFPDKPQLALISSIQGGSQTAIGNMANVAQFDLQKFSLAASVGQWRQHVDTKLVCLAYALAIGELQKFNILSVPPVQNAPGHARHAGMVDDTGFEPVTFRM